jgi:hypothetical protein
MTSIPVWIPGSRPMGPQRWRDESPIRSPAECREVARAAKAEVDAKFPEPTEAERDEIECEVTRLQRAASAKEYRRIEAELLAERLARNSA